MSGSTKCGRMPRRESTPRSPDTVSPLFADRPIRPLPRHGLRAKLSPEQAKSIVYPPRPPSPAELANVNYGPSDLNERGAPAWMDGSPSVCTCGAGGHGAAAESGDEHHFVAESEDDDEAYELKYPIDSDDHHIVTDAQRKHNHAARAAANRFPPAPASTASSADGYDSFENTSNKKKRKIPVSSGSASNMYASSLSAELANMGISNDHDPPLEGKHASTRSVARHPHLVSAGAERAARARYARSIHEARRKHHEGRVIAANEEGGNVYTSNLSARSRGGNWTGQGTLSRTGDASMARHIINGEDSAVSTSPHSPASKTPKTAFTFTCESDSSHKVQWEDSTTHAPPLPPVQQNGHTKQPNGHSGPQAADLPPPLPPKAQNHHAAAQQIQDTLPPVPRPRRRRPSREYALAAQHRRLQQEYTNYHKKPVKDDIWVCEFCEYEDIFGVPPSALIRQYEIKDRAERHRAEERRRLLEKAKMRNRKGKKGSGKGGHAPNDGSKTTSVASGEPGPDLPPQSPSVVGDHEHDHDHVHGDEYYDDDEEYVDDGYGPPYDDQSHGRADEHYVTDDSRYKENVPVRQNGHDAVGRKKVAPASTRVHAPSAKA